MTIRGEVETMSRRAEYKRHDDLSAWDLDAGCRRIVNQAAPGMRRLKAVLRRMARKRLKRRQDNDR